MTNLFSSQKLPLYILPFIGGVFYASGFPMSFAPAFFLGPIIGLALLFQSFNLEKKDNKFSWLRSELLSVLCFCLGYNLFGYYWIPYTIKVFGGIPVPFNFLVGVLFSIIIAPHLLAFVIGRHFYNKLSFKSSTLTNTWSKRSLLFAIAFTVLEYFTPQQFPSHAGHSWLTLAPRLGLAPYLGASFFSFINVWVALSLANFIKNKTIAKTPIIVFFIVLITNIFMPITWQETKKDHTTQLRFVQANIGNFVKVDSEFGKNYAISEVFQIYRELNAFAPEAPLDLIIWPETAYPLLLKSKNMKIDSLHVPRLFREVINSQDAELFTGGYDNTDTENDYYFETQYNTAFHFGKNSLLKNSYNKIKLIPFGENLPFGPFNPYLAKVIKNISFFAYGKEYPLFKLDNGATFSSAICYEILFSGFMREQLNSLDETPEFILNLTNDSWYGDTAEPHQHMFLAKWRALEFNIPIVRSTNTGITAVLYPDGSESRRLGINQKSILDVKLETVKKPNATVFQKYGWLPLISIWILLIIGFYIKGKFFSRLNESLP
jgi:apolipoprotein N-acyltransferase